MRSERGSAAAKVGEMPRIGCHRAQQHRHERDDLLDDYSLNLCSWLVIVYLLTRYRDDKDDDINESGLLLVSRNLFSFLFHPKRELSFSRKKKRERGSLAFQVFTWTRQGEIPICWLSEKVCWCRHYVLDDGWAGGPIPSLYKLQHQPFHIL